MNNIQTKKTTLLRTVSAVVILSVGTLSHHAALAQPVDSTDPIASNNGTEETKGGIEEILVTARKRAENPQKVPISLSGFDGDQLKEQSINTIANLQNATPGLVIQQGLDDPQSIVVTMRGRKQDDATMAVDASVSLNVDGLNIPRTIGLAGSMLDINRVEVLRGPQGTLYGRNSTGGAIGLFTNDPTDNYSGSVDVTAGDYSTWNTTGILNLPITDNLAARFVVSGGEDGGYAHNTTGTPLNDSSNQYYRGKLRWSGEDNWQAVLSAHYEQDHSGNYRAFIPGLDPANFQGNGLPEGGYLTLETEADLGVSEAQAIALERSWTAQKSPWFTLDNTHGPAFVSNIHRWDVGLNVSGNLTDGIQFRSITGIQDLARSTSGGPQWPIFIDQQQPHSSGTYYSQELQILGSTPSLNWVVGTYGGYETGTDGQKIFFLPAELGTGAVDNNNKILNTTLAGFAQATWEFLPAWHLTGGVRYTVDTRQIDANAYGVDLLDPTVHVCEVPAPGYATADPSNPASAQCPRTFKTNFSQPTWLASLDHQITSDILAYAKVATGYRSGGLNADTGSVDLVTFQAFAPETNTEYEAGLKSKFFDRKVKLNVAAFWDDYSNLQVQSIVLGANNSFQTTETNAATARIKGVEVEGDVVIGEGLVLHGSTAYTNARYLKYVDLSGNHSSQPFSVPKWTFNVSANYTYPTNIGDASLQLDYAWKSSVNVVPPSTLVSAVTQPAYGLLNARVSMHIDTWDMDVAVIGQNLTNEVYFDQGFNFGGAGLDFDQVFIGGPPRTFAIELVKKFGE